MGRPVLVLPEETQADLRRLRGMDDPVLLNTFIAELADAGWGYQPSATALGLHRQSVRQRAQQSHSGALAAVQLPPVPTPPRYLRREEPVAPTLSEVEERKLRRLNKLARRLRPEHGEDDPHRLASEELSAFMDALTRRGIQYKQIGAVLDIKPMTVRARLKRHGYRQVSPSLKPYQGRRPDREGVSA